MTGAQVHRQEPNQSLILAADFIMNKWTSCPGCRGKWDLIIKSAACKADWSGSWLCLTFNILMQITQDYVVKEQTQMIANYIIALVY